MPARVLSKAAAAKAKKPALVTLCNALVVGVVDVGEIEPLLFVVVVEVEVALEERLLEGWCSGGLVLRDAMGLSGEASGLKKAAADRGLLGAESRLEYE
jgi:hypothetical protein